MIENDINLLNLIYRDSKKLKKIYRPGPYWMNQTKNSLIEIKKNGLNNFRGDKNGATHCYGDAAIVDTRSLYNVGLRKILKWIYKDLYPFKNLYNTQVKYTKNYFNQWMYFFNNYLIHNKRVTELLEKYEINFETNRGGCLRYFSHNNKNISHSYLYLLDTIDRIDKKNPIKSNDTFFEIGGGFGINVHILVELFDVKKIIYLDIAPNIYVASQYLKSFYGDKVKCYKNNRDQKIEFSNNNELEIFCILPNQIENIVSKVDHFHNAHSFVEMTYDIVENYSKFINKLLKKNKGFISLESYQTNNLLQIEKIIGNFNGDVEKTSYLTLDGKTTYDQYTIKL